MTLFERVTRMEKKKLLKLQERGWKVGNASDFLELSQEESAYVELKVSLSQYLQKKRQTRHMTQETLARLMHSSQSRVAKMEKSDSTVSIDLMVRSLLALGTSKTELAKAMTWGRVHSSGPLSSFHRRASGRTGKLSRQSHGAFSK
jgi:ribosome-binding protein aMBF1 (putative translation factor)